MTQINHDLLIHSFGLPVNIRKAGTDKSCNVVWLGQNLVKYHGEKLIYILRSSRMNGGNHIIQIQLLFFTMCLGLTFDCHRLPGEEFTVRCLRTYLICQSFTTEQTEVQRTSRSSKQNWVRKTWLKMTLYTAISPAWVVIRRMCCRGRQPCECVSSSSSV